MNIYKVISIDNDDEFIGTTDEVMDKFYITKDALYWHAKTKSQYGGYIFEKIGTNNKGNKPKKIEPIGTKTNRGLDDDLLQARKCGLSYGQWKLLQNRG